MLKKISIHVVIAIICSANAVAASFTVTRPDKSLIAFTLIGGKDANGWQKYEAITTGGNLGKAQSQDIYSVNCGTKRIFISHGLTSGGIAGNTAPDTGPIEQTKQDDVSPIISLACK
jgi:hypothetical protein